MERSLSKIVIGDVIFLFLLILSGAASGVMSDVLYYAAFALPIVYLSVYLKRNKTELYPLSFIPDRRTLSVSAVTLFPFLSIMLLISFLTSFIMNLVGFGSPDASLEGSLFELLTLHALLPSFMEEILFRYFPIRMLAGESRKNTLIVSSLLFALTHCNLFALPYALFAGFVLCAVDIATDSIVPSVLLHLFNNTASVIWQTYNGDVLFVKVFLTAILLLSLISLLIIFIFRKKLFPSIKRIFEDKSNVLLTKGVIFFAAATLIISVFGLFGQ